MALPTSTNEVTARKLSSVISGLWNKIKNLLAGKSDITEGVYYVVGTHDYPAWAANHAYAVNDTVNYGNQIKVCKTAHTSGSSYDSSKWNNLGTPVLKGAIDGVTALYTGLKIAYRWPCYGGTSSTYLNINGLGNVYVRRNNGNLTTHLPIGSVSFLAYDGTYWQWADYDSNTNNWVTTMGAYCDTAAATAAKVATSTNTVLTAGMSFLIRIVNANTSASKLTLNINSQGAKDVWINGAISSASNYTIPAGEHWCHYDGSVFHIWTDGTAQFKQLKLTNKLSDANIASAATWNAKQNALTAQTAYSAKGTATKVPQITTNSLGQVTGITEVTISGVTPASHTHGNITNAGAIGTASGNAVYTTTNGVLTAGSLATTDPSVSGNSLTFIDTISQDSKGKITATKKSVTVDSAMSSSSTNPVQNKVVDSALSNKAPLASPALTGTPTAPTAAAGTNTTQIATTAFVKQAVTDGLATADAMIYKGTIAGGSTGNYGALTAAASKGWTYKVTTAGKIDGIPVEVGDILICNTDNTAAATSSNYSTIAANWDFVQTNIDGAVTGPSSVTSGQVAAFDGTTGKVIKALDAAGVRTAAGLGTASTKDVPSSGNASNTQVVLGNDTRLTDSRTPTSHAHGNIQNGGTLQTTDVTIANGDKLVVTDSSDSNKVARTSVSFDGSTTTKALTQKGTFESFAKSGDITSAIQALDVASVGGAGKYISAISETDGKISATATTMDTTPTASSTNAVTSGGVKTALDGKASTALDNVTSKSLANLYLKTDGYASHSNIEAGYGLLATIDYSNHGGYSNTNAVFELYDKASNAVFAGKRYLVVDIRNNSASSGSSGSYVYKVTELIQAPVWSRLSLKVYRTDNTNIRIYSLGAGTNYYGAMVCKLVSCTDFDGASKYSKITMHQGNATKTVPSGTEIPITTVTEDYSTYRTIPQDVSKGSNLVVNGTGSMCSNYNWPDFEWVGNYSYNASAGAFKRSFTGNDSVFKTCSEFISVDPNKIIDMSVDINILSELVACTIRMAIAFYDIDKKLIEAPSIMYGANTCTELAQDLNPGDTVVHLASVANWTTDIGQTYKRGFIFWDYTNSYGYMYPQETYSRNYYADYFDSASSVNTTNNTITLNKAWAGPKKFAGTKVSKCDSGGTHNYISYRTIATTEVNTWFNLHGFLTGMATTGDNPSYRFRQGTAFVKVGFVNSTSNANYTYLFTNFRVYELPISAPKITTARKLAVSLSNTSTDTSFNGTADVTNIKVSGTLPVANGGTGQTSLSNVTVGTADKPTGFSGRSTSITWGTLTPTHEYTAVTRWDTASGGSVVFADKSGMTSMQIDGVFYQREGNYAVLDTSSTLDASKVSGTVATATTATKLGSSTLGSGTKPIYLSSGSATECSTYAGGTAVTLNNASKAASTASFYAPTAGGTANYVLIGNGTTSAPTWAEKAPKATTADMATVADSVSTAIGSGEIKLLGVANNVAGNYQPKMHPTIRAYYDNNSNGNILLVGPERGTRGAADKGGIRLSSGTGYYTQLQTADFTADRWHKLPDESGNLAITSGTYPNMSVGTADYASAAKSGSALEQAIAPDADVSLILYGDSNYSTVKALYNAGKKLYLLIGGSIQPSGTFEYRIPLTQITYDANKEVNAFYFEVSQDDRNGASEVGSIASYRLDSSGWTMSAKQVGYAVNAGNANNYIGGGGIDTALQGKMATNGSNATNVAGGNIIRSLNDWSNPADAEMIAAASSSGQGKYTLIKLWDTYFKNKVNQIIPNVGYMGANAMTAMQKNGTDTMPGNNCKICLDPNTYYSFGYNGFTCLGHYRPTGSGQKYYGWCGNFAQNGGIVEIDFDYTATVEIARGSITSLPESMDVSFAAMTDNNDFKYGFALDASTIFATSQETMRFEVSGTTSKQIKGHARLIGRGSASSTQTGTRIFVGAVQITSNDHFLVLNVNNIRIKVTGGEIYDVTYL